MLEIDFSQYHSNLKIKREEKKSFIFCFIRKKYLVLTPEELVRQTIIHYLISEQNFSKNKIAVEKQLMVNELKKRCDILTFDKTLTPFLLIECKATNVQISQDTFRQIAWYNMPLKVPYLMVSNGIQTFCCSMDYQNNSYQFIREIPYFQ